MNNAVLLPTGTEGPKPIPAAAGPTKPTFNPGRIPYNVAFREVLRFVTAGLKSAGEQSRQDMVSTILIAAAKQGHISLWERDAA